MRDIGSRLSPKDQALYSAVDEVLHYIWDPIGISAIPQARDEYQGYLPHAFGLLRDGASAEAIASYLGQIASERMGLSSVPAHELEVANVLLEWKGAIDAKFA